jgi:hypothetical protein
LVGLAEMSRHSFRAELLAVALICIGRNPKRGPRYGLATLRPRELFSLNT